MKNTITVEQIQFFNEILAQMGSSYFLLSFGENEKVMLAYRVRDFPELDPITPDILNYICGLLGFENPLF